MAIGTVSTAVVVAAVTGFGDVPGATAAAASRPAPTSATPTTPRTGTTPAKSRAEATPATTRAQAAPATDRAEVVPKGPGFWPRSPVVAR
jgi:hypothetical protein